MPLTLTLTNNALPEDKLPEAVQRLTDSFLRHHGLENNSVMRPNVTAQVQILEEDRTFSGGKPFRGIWVEWKAPSFAFATREVQQAHVRDVTGILHELSGGQQPEDNIYFNVVHAVDGAWALDGQAMTNAQLGEALAKGAPGPGAG